MPERRSPLGALYDRVVPLPPFISYYPASSWPEELYGTKRSCQGEVRRAFVLLLTLMATMFVTVPLLKANLAEEQLPGVLGPFLAVWFLLLAWSALKISAGAGGLAEKRCKRAAQRTPEAFPVALRDDYVIGGHLSSYLSASLDADQREVAQVLLNDGFDGTCGELVETVHFVLVR